MGASGDITPEELAEAFRRLSEWATVESRYGRSPFKERLSEHFGEDPATYPLTAETIPVYDLPNLQLALDAYLGAAGRQHSLIGLGGPVDHMEISLAGLVHDYGFWRRGLCAGRSSRWSGAARSPASRSGSS